MKWYTIKHECVGTETILRSWMVFHSWCRILNISGANLILLLRQCPLVESPRGELVCYTAVFSVFSDDTKNGCVADLRAARVRIKNCRWQVTVWYPREGLVFRGGSVTQRVFNRRVSWWKCTRPFGVVLAWILENKLPLGVGSSGRIARLMRWNETRTYWPGLDSASDLWLLSHFKLRSFRLSHRASRTGLWSLVLSLIACVAGVQRGISLTVEIGVKGNCLNRSGSGK